MPHSELDFDSLEEPSHKTTIQLHNLELSFSIPLRTGDVLSMVEFVLAQHVVRTAWRPGPPMGFGSHPCLNSSTCACVGEDKVHFARSHRLEKQHATRVGFDMFLPTE